MHELIQEKLNFRGLTFWGGIWSGGIVGPYFIDVTLTGEHTMKYEVTLFCLNEGKSPLHDNTEIIW
jgi:hypothetical protein